MMTHDRQIAGIEPDLPSYLIELLATLPARVDRRNGAELVTQHFFPTSHRTLERWPLPWQRVNGRAVTRTSALFREAHTRLTAAPEIMGGRSRKNAA
jgi:hypothetical protein